MKPIRILWALCLWLTIMTTLFGCSTTSQLRQCRAGIHRLNIEKDYLTREIQDLKEKVEELEVSLKRIKFNIELNRKAILDSKTGGPQPTPPEVIDELIEQLQLPEVDLPEVSNQLRAYGKPAVIALILRLKDTDIDFHRRVELALEQMAPSDAVPILVESLNRTEIRNSAARILANLNDRSAILPLAEHLKSEDTDFVFTVSETLVKLKDRRGIPVLIENLKTDNAARRTLAFDTLSKATGLTFDYKPYLSKEERLRSIRQWEIWWLKKGDSFEFKQ